jgi:transposase
MKTNHASHRNNLKYIGVDVGKSMLDIHIYEVDKHFQCQNNPQAIKSMVSKLARFKIARIVVEATGRYERELVEALALKDLPVIVVQPKKVRDFANAQGVIAKTDKIDSRVIAEFGAKLKPPVRELQSREILQIRDLLARRRQLMETRTQELNRSKLASPAIQRSNRRMLKFLDKEIAWVDVQLEKQVHDIVEWKRTAEILLSTPGIGTGVAYTLLGELPELGKL